MVHKVEQAGACIRIDPERVSADAVRAAAEGRALEIMEDTFGSPGAPHAAADYGAGGKPAT